MKCESTRSSHVGVFGVRSSGTSAATIGIKRTDESVTARNAVARLAPLRIELTRMTFAGRAQTMPVMNTTRAGGIPA